MGEEKYHYGDSVWFFVVQTTTVGYGDVHPNTDASRIVNIFFLLTGTLVVGTNINAFLGFIVLITSGLLFLSLSESKRDDHWENFTMCLEFVFVTITTVGFGNISMESPEGRVFGAFFI